MSGSRRKRIEQLRNELRTLPEEPPYGGQWRIWYQSTCRTLVDCYGIESAELRGFMEIRFEVGRLEPIVERLHRVLLEEFRPILLGAHSPIAHYYIAEADEYLLSVALTTE